MIFAGPSLLTDRLASMLLNKRKEKDIEIEIETTHRHQRDRDRDKNREKDSMTDGGVYQSTRHSDSRSDIATCSAPRCSSTE